MSPSDRNLVLVADDLTGALDTAAEFVAALGPVRVGWGKPRAVLGTAVAFDIASREGSPATAAEATRIAAGLLGLGRAGIAFHKVDSLLRGHAGTELLAAFSAGGFTHAIVAPAFPFQKRATRGGRQWAPIDGVWRATGEDIAATLAALGTPARLARAGDLAAPGITVYDAETDEDLATIVADARDLAGARILWCGSGGLAGMLGGGTRTIRPDDLPGPVLGLFGTDHPVTVEQLRRTGELTLPLTDGGIAAAERVDLRLAGLGTTLVRFALPPMDRAVAAARIARATADLVGRLAPPATLVAGGGETLRSICDALGAVALDVFGRIVPGVPVARIVGGRWAGVTVVSKSGAFGDPDFLARLVAPAVAASGSPSLLRQDRQP